MSNDQPINSQPNRPPSVLQPDEDWPPRPLSSKEAYSQTGPPNHEPDKASSLWPLKVALGVVLVSFVALAAGLLRNSGSGSDSDGTNQATGIDTSADASETPSESIAPAAGLVTTPAEPDTDVNASAAAGDSAEAAQSGAAGTDETDAGDDDSDAGAEEPTPPSSVSDDALVRGVMSAGRIDLEGSVASDQVAQSLVALMESVVGEGNVSSSLVIDPATPEAEQMSLILADDIVFPLGSAVIETEFLPVLDQIVQFMRLDPNITIVVEGHTDSQGDPILNLALSQQRAEAVVDYFAANGINRFRIEPRGRGNTEPLADESTEEGRRQNRRIEFDIEGFRVAMADSR